MAFPIAPNDGDEYTTSGGTIYVYETATTECNEMPRGFTEGCWYNYKEIEALEKRVIELELVLKKALERIDELEKLNNKF